MSLMHRSWSTPLLRPRTAFRANKSHQPLPELRQSRSSGGLGVRPVSAIERIASDKASSSSVPCSDDVLPSVPNCSSEPLEQFPQLSLDSPEGRTGNTKLDSVRLPGASCQARDKPPLVDDRSPSFGRQAREKPPVIEGSTSPGGRHGKQLSPLSTSPGGKQLWAIEAQTSPPSQPASSSSRGSDASHLSGESDTTEPPAILAHMPRSRPDTVAHGCRKDKFGSASWRNNWYHSKGRGDIDKAAEMPAVLAPMLVERRPATALQTKESAFDANLSELQKSSTGADATSAIRIVQAREKILGKNARTLDWTIAIEHEHIRCIRVQLSASTTKKVRSIGNEDQPACLIEVCAEGYPSEAGAARGAKLIRCSGSLVPRTSRLHVNWLGRKGASPGNARSNIAPLKADAQGRSITVAQAILGTLASISMLFGMINVELDAEDNGSGKLVQYYASLGLSVTAAVPGFDIEMEAPMHAITCHAPADWLQRLVPQGFNAWTWLKPPCPAALARGGADPVRAILISPDVPWDWKWTVESPVGAKVEAKLSLSSSDRICCEVRLTNRQGEELVFARGAVRIKLQTLRVLWWGRSKSRVVHESVKGRLAYRAGTTAETIGRMQVSSESNNCTTATAVLGALAGFARWFGTTTVQLTLCDASQKFVSHLCNLGFAEPPGGTSVLTGGDPVALTASCTSLANNCCPPEWRSELPPDGALSMLAGLSRD